MHIFTVIAHDKKTFIKQMQFTCGPDNFMSINKMFKCYFGEFTRFKLAQSRILVLFFLYLLYILIWFINIFI